MTFIQALMGSSDFGKTVQIVLKRCEFALHLFNDSCIAIGKSGMHGRVLGIQGVR